MYNEKIRMNSVPIEHKLIPGFKNVLNSELPGLKVQMIMSPVREVADRYYQTPDNAVPASVLLLLYPKNGDWHTAFVKRSSHENDKHSGQISLPGGRKDKSDIDEQGTALRELEEEAGIDKKDVEILGKLTPLYVYASNHLVYPFVGIIDRSPLFTIQQKEVDKLIEVPISYFYSESIIKYTELNIRGYRLPNVPYYDLHGEILWGATAMIFSEFLWLWEKSRH